MGMTIDEFKRLSHGQIVFTNSGRPVKVIETDPRNGILKGEGWWSNDSLNIEQRSDRSIAALGQKRERQENALMLYDPATGAERPYPSHAAQWRAYHGKVAWLWNPWIGRPRDPRHIGSDVFGILIVPPQELDEKTNSAPGNVDEAAPEVRRKLLNAAYAADTIVPRGKIPDEDQHDIPAFLRRGSD